MEIAFVGTGVMGRPMALNLIASGHRLRVVDRPSLALDLRDTAEVMPDAARATEGVDTVILMLPDTSDVESALFDRDGVAEGLTPNTLVIDMSTISPVATSAFAERIRKMDCAYLDAPVSGGEIGAKAGTLTIMVGGPREAFDRARPLFEVLGKNITRIGDDSGSGQICKLANQIIVALNIEAVSEALTFAARAGADPAKVREALTGGFASSRILEVHGERMLKRNFEPGFRVRLHQKDLNLALDTARRLGMSLPNTATTQQLFSAVVALGGDERDHSSLITVIERLAGIPAA